MILAIDPSDTVHAWAVVAGTFDQPELVQHGRDFDAEWAIVPGADKPCVVIEMIASYGMAVGAETFDTCIEIGRLMERLVGRSTARITRLEVKRLVCGSVAARDPNVRQSIIDRFGGSQAIRKGGALYGVAKDTWAAIAVGVAALHPEARFYVPAHLRAPKEP